MLFSGHHNNHSPHFNVCLFVLFLPGTDGFAELNRHNTNDLLEACMF